MQVGDLVRVTRASIGIPKDSLALVEAKIRENRDFAGVQPYEIWQVYLLQAGRQRRYLGRDLEVISESR